MPVVIILFLIRFYCCKFTSSFGLHNLYECVTFDDKLLGTAFSLEMESSVCRIYLRVTVPLTNLHQDLDFVVALGFFFLP